MDYIKVETKDGTFFLREPKVSDIIDYLPILPGNINQGVQREMMLKFIEKFLVKVEKDGKVIEDFDIRKVRISTLITLIENINKLLNTPRDE